MGIFDNQSKKINNDKQEEAQKEKKEEIIAGDKRIKELEDKNLELENNWKRALADYQNLQKRTISERDDYVQYGLKTILLKFLDIFDQLIDAQKHLKDKGLELVIKSFEDAFKSEGVSEIDRLNKNFDPRLDECIEKREGSRNNIIVEVARNGYMIRDRVLRPARVIVEIKNS